MGNGLFANCCRHVTDLIFQTRSFNSPDERSPLLPKPPPGCASCPERPEATQRAGPYPDIIPSAVVTGSLQECTEYIEELCKAKDKEGMVTVCDKSCCGAGAAGPLRQAEASRAVAVLPADLGEGPAGLVDHAPSLEACQSCVKLEDSGLAHRSCRWEEHVEAADGGYTALGARPAGAGEGRAALCLDTALADPDSAPKHRDAAASLASPGTPPSALPAGAGKTPPAQRAVMPVPSGEVSPKAQHTRTGFVATEPAACPGGRSGCDPGSQVQVLPSKQQQKKRRKKKKLPLLGAQRHGTLTLRVAQTPVCS